MISKYTKENNACLACFIKQQHTVKEIQITNPQGR